jgi:hypothetical protein
MIRAIRTPLPVKALLALALLLLALVALLCRPAASPAKDARSACSHSGDAAKHVRACAGRAHSGRSPARAKSRRSGHRHRLHKKKKPAQQGAGAPVAAAAPAPAACEDGSRPRSDGEGAFSCGDGSEPSCGNGADPVLSSSRAKLVCPAPPASAPEWSEAECADGSDPESSAAGGWSCEDGSAPTCPEGTAMRSSEDGSVLLCLAHGASSPGEEEDEGESEDDVSSARAASAS